MRILRLLPLFLIAGAAIAGAQTPPPMPEGPLPTSLKKFDADYTKTKAAFAKKPTDKKLKAAFVKATVVYGHESMTSPDLDARVKYRKALRLYREALKLDPKNPVAKQEHDLIVSIYKQMGRPVPK